MKHTLTITKRTPLLLTLCVSALVLSACQTTSNNEYATTANNPSRTSNISEPHYQRPNPQATQQSQKIDRALEQAAITAAVKGNKTQSLNYLEKIYKRKSTDPIAGLNYGKALRSAGEFERAALVLEPFAKDSHTPSIAKTEYAAAQLALGNNDLAKKFAQSAILQNQGDARAYHYLGIALDAEGNHEEAERAFRKGLNIWEGDPIPIMNNLALNLASQNSLGEAIQILQKAKSIAPNRIEVERNLRIVRALQESYNYTP